MSNFKKTISVIYPPDNTQIFEEWFAEHYSDVYTDRELIPVFFTSYWVNNNYGNDKKAFNDLQSYIDSLDRGNKYICVCQYDDGVLIDFKDLDVLQFNMSKNIGVSIPLLCKPHPYNFTGGKKIFANFVGSRTHPIRNYADKLHDTSGYYISFTNHDIESYCRIMHESMFTLCFRGYGLNSFRIAEAIQYGSIPVYISDEFVLPYDVNFEYYGVLIHEKDAHRIDEILQSIEPYEVVKMQERLKEIYDTYYTYEGNLKKIINCIEAEYYSREQGGKVA